jgi:hypothetical protein
MCGGEGGLSAGRPRGLCGRPRLPDSRRGAVRSGRLKQLAMSNPHVPPSVAGSGAGSRSPQASRSPTPSAGRDRPSSSCRAGRCPARCSSTSSLQLPAAGPRSRGRPGCAESHRYAAIDQAGTDRILSLTVVDQTPKPLATAPPANGRRPRSRPRAPRGAVARGDAPRHAAARRRVAPGQRDVQRPHRPRPVSTRKCRSQTP